MKDKKSVNLVEVPMPRVAGMDLSREMAEHPYKVLGASFLVGYVLGGGLFTRFTARAVSMGLRAVALPLLARQVTRWQESLLAQEEQQPSASRAARAPEPR